MNSSIFKNVSEINFDLSELADMPLPDSVLMVKPDFFSVDYVINPHMEGNIGKVDKEKAWLQWEELRNTFRHLGFGIHAIEGQQGLPDMVFSANQSLPYVDERQKKHVIMSIMHSAQRKEEVPFLEQWYRQHGYQMEYLDPDRTPDFEGMGDAIWHSGKKLLWGGYGYRSSLEAYEQIRQFFDVPIIALELRQEDFYHLDTCFCSLNSESALIYPGAFTNEGLKLIKKLIPNIYEADEQEARNLFACNAACPDGKHVIIQKGCKKTTKKLSKAGFEIIELDTSEYLKSGGSVFCMKMMLWT